MNRRISTHKRILAERLECRTLLAGNPSHELLATFPASATMPIDESIVAGGNLYVTLHQETNPESLWCIAPGNSTAELLMTSNAFTSADRGISGLSEFHGKLHFFANTPSGDGLFTSDGTVSGTQPVKIIRPTAGSLPLGTFVLNDRLHFFWRSSGIPTRMWSSDGTDAGTTSIWDAPAGWNANSVGPAVNSYGFFGGQGQLWRTDGTAAGTSAIWGPVTTSTYPTGIIVVGDKLFFLNKATSQPDGGGGVYSAALDGSNVIGLPSSGITSPTLQPLHEGVIVRAQSGNFGKIISWDGTEAAGETLIEGNVSNGIDVSEPIAATDSDTAVFLQTAPAANRSIYTTDGTIAGTQPALAKSFSSYGLYSAAGRAFVQDLASNSSIRLYGSDGTAASTRPTSYLFSNLSGYGQFLGTMNDRLVFAVGADGTRGIWSLDPNVQSASVSGIGYYDRNRNGIRDGFELKYGGNAYIDTNNNGVFDTGEYFSSSANNQPYLLDGLPPGSYTLRFQGNPSEPLATPAGGAHQLNLGPLEARTGADFIPVETSTVAWGVVYNDLNSNGQRDPGEPGVENDSVFLDVNNNKLRDASEPLVKTAADGTYGFVNAVAAGNYAVRRVQVGGWAQTNPPGLTGRSVAVVNGQSAQVGDFGIVATPPGSITGSVWNDWNNNGVRDAGDTPLVNAIIYIDTTEDGAFTTGERSGATNSAGRYTFTNTVPGDYTVRVRLLTGDQQTLPTGGAGRLAVVASNQTAVLGDFLIYNPTLTPPAGRLIGGAWIDSDADGTRDPDEPAGVSLTVFIDLNNDAQLDQFDRTGQTDNAGGYSFDHSTAGTYKIYVSLPPGWTQTSPAANAPITANLSTGQQLQLPQFGVRSNDVTAPGIASKWLLDAPVRAVLTFDEAVAPIVGGPAIELRNSINGQLISAGDYRCSFASNVMTLDFPTLPQQSPPAGLYRITIPAGAVRDLAGNLTSTSATFDFAFAGGAGDVIALPSNFGTPRIEAFLLSATALIDLNNNGLIVDYSGTSPLAQITDKIRTARNGGAWTGPGITSSAAGNATPRNTTLGVMESADFKSIYGPAAPFGGHAIDATAVLVKYTYYGDTDFNGTVNFDDYSRTDAGFNGTRTGWLNGDFDGNGSVNFDDYALIDLAFNTQGPGRRPARSGGRG